MAIEPPQFQNFGIPPIWSSLSTIWKYCYPCYCFLTPQFQTLTNLLILIFWGLVISLNYITINNITALVQCNTVLFRLDILCLFYFIFFGYFYQPLFMSLKRLLNPPQIHHCLLFANSSFKYAKCSSLPPFLGKFIPNMLIFYSCHKKILIFQWTPILEFFILNPIPSF